MRGHGMTKSLVLIASAGLLAVGVGAAADYAAAYDQETVQAKVKNGTLKVEGTKAGEEIALRLRDGDPSIVEVVTPDGLLSFQRDQFTKIRVEADDGDDLVRVDDSNGAFTNTEETTLAGEDDDDDLRGGQGNEVLDGGRGDDAADGNQGADVGLMGRGDDSFTWDPGDGSDRSSQRYGSA